MYRDVCGAPGFSKRGALSWGGPRVTSICSWCIKPEPALFGSKC